jgi:hypothetical protein
MKELTLAAWILAAALPPLAQGQLAIDTSNPSDWKISNGALSLDWSSTAGNVWAIYLAGNPNDLIDITNTVSSGQPKGFYMDNAGVGGGATTAGYDLQPGRYLDWWITTASNSSNAFTTTEHYVVYPSDPGIHAYVLFTHGPADIAGSLGQVQYVMRVNLSLFTSTYSYNSGLNNLGPTLIPLPPAGDNFSTDPGRDVQDATVDLHGLTPPAGYVRQFYTKYDYSSYEYLHQLHGVFGDTYGAWTILPSQESMVGGPVKQDLIFTGNLLIGELLSDHLAYNVGYTPAQGVASRRLFGPIYFRFNSGTPAAMFQDALAARGALSGLYDSEADLLASGYVPSGLRGSVSATVAGGGSTDPNGAWVVLADNQRDFQFTNVGAQYWAPSPAGSASLPRVVPGTYRLSAYVLGQWGETRIDNLTVASGATASVAASFTPENFGSAPPIWTIGSPTRSANKFRHGTDANGQDDREYWGNWNYWADFAANSGAAVYYATAVGATPATNDLSQLNYIQWHNFNPGLYGGFYSPGDDTTDGYKYIAPSYVKNAATASVPPWQVFFTTTAAQQAQGPYAILSVSLAATNSNLTVSLNGHSLTWPGYSTLKTSDAQVRSGLAGTHQWIAFEWPGSDLAPAGQSNQILLSVDHSQGVMYDALRLEVAPQSALPGLRGWNDYEYVAANVYLPANDALPNPSGPRTDRLVNLSGLGVVAAGSPMRAGFAVSGTAPKTLVLRGVGPGLSAFGVPGLLSQPKLTLFDSLGNVLATNSGWGGASALAAAFGKVGAFPLPLQSADAALQVTLPPGTYTLQLDDAGPGAGGTALVEAYDASPDSTGFSQKLVNASLFGQSGGGTILTGGFSVSGAYPKRLLIRAAGPALATLGVSGTAASPQISVYGAQGQLLAQNAGWGTQRPASPAQLAASAATVASAAASVQAFPLANGSKDAALIAVLAPGSYSAQVSAPGGAGAVLFEVYELPE